MEIDAPASDAAASCSAALKCSAEDAFPAGFGDSMASEDSIRTSAADLAGLGGPGSGNGDAPPLQIPRTSEMWALDIGTAFPSKDHPKYHISAQIDDGGMGIVYEAHQGELGVVAIKVIKPRILSQTASERFLNEARAMGKVRSEHGIATIFDCDWYVDAATGTKAPYIVMEYVPGALPITTYANEHRLGLRSRLQLFQRVCEAVAAAHRADIIHRDLKPANVMVSGSGDPKVIDFGLAVVRDPTEHAMRLPSERGGLFGTLEYMSPEQAAKRFDPHVLTSASDVYSLGVILYELLLGELPYATNPTQAVRKMPDGTTDYSESTRIIREDAPVAPHRVKRELHPGVEAILVKALQKEPSKRYRTAGDLAEAINRHLRGALRRDVVRSVPLVIAALLVAHLVGVPAMSEWPWLNRMYQRAAMWAAPALTEFEHVMLVTADDTTDLSSFELSEATPLEKVGFGPGERQRPLWAAACQKLAKSGCRVVALDLVFDMDSTVHPSDDEELIAGIRSLQQREIDVVLATWEWQDRIYPLSRVMSQAANRLGSIWLQANETGWKVEAVLMRDKAVMGCFALQAVAGWRHGGKPIIYDYAEGASQVRIKYADAQGVWRADDDPINVNRIVRGDSPDANRRGVDSTDFYSADDYLALLLLPPFPPDSALNDAILEADALMRMDDRELQRRCADKLVVVANRHPGHVGEFSVTPDGRTLPKSFGHALAMEAMLQNRSTMMSTDRRTEEAATLIAAMAGIVVAFMFPGRWMAAGAAALAGIVILTAGSLVVTRMDGPALNPIIPSAAMMLATLTSFAAPMIVRQFIK